MVGEKQKSLSNKVDIHKIITFIGSLTSDRDKARLGALGLSHAGDWLNVTPSPSLGLNLRPQEFRIATLYRLGAPIFKGDGPCTACRAESDQYGDHAISCGWEGERIARHNSLRDALYHTAVCASLGPVREERAILPGTNAKPADLLIPNWSAGKAVAMDVTVINPLQLALLARSAEAPGHSLSVAFNRKYTQYGEACLDQGIVFAPLPVETFGGWHESAANHIKRLGKALGRSTGQDEGETTRHLFQRLSVLLVRGNVSLLINRIPDFPSPEVDGIT